jgi:hypothetical protein
MALTDGYLVAKPAFDRHPVFMRRAGVEWWIAHRVVADGACYAHPGPGECVDGGYSYGVVVGLLLLSAVLVYGFVFVRRDNVRSVFRQLAPALAVAVAAVVVVLAYSWG